MITSVFPASERGRALGLNAVVVALGVTAGPTIGGLVTQYLSWRWIFYVNVPNGVLVFSMGMRLLTEPLHSNKQRFDPVGAVLLAIGLASMTLGFSFGQEWGWTSPGIISSLVVGVVALVAAVVVERRVPDPILNLSLLTNRVFASANISFLLAMLALFAPGFLLPFYFEELRGFPAVQAGLLLTPLSLTLAVMAPLSGSLADRFGSRILAPLGLTIACFGLILLSTTVVTKSGQPDDAGSDSDEPEPDGCGGKRTSQDGSNERAEVFQAGKRRVGVFQECSEGPSRASQPPLSFERAQALGGGVWQAGFPAFFLL